MTTKTVLTLTATLAALVASAVGVTAAGALTTSQTVRATLNEFNVVPSAQAARAGKVTFVVRNTGKVMHELVVVRTSKPAGSLLKGKEADETGAVGEVGELKPGATKKLTLTLGRGHYALLCNLPGHYLAGQFADFYVK